MSTWLGRFVDKLEWTWGVLVNEIAPSQSATPDVNCIDGFDINVIDGDLTVLLKGTSTEIIFDNVPEMVAHVTEDGWWLLEIKGEPT